APRGARPGVHDHTPHHGGVVVMVGMRHLEAVATPDGTVRVYVTDVWRRPLPLEDASGSVTLELPAGRRSVPLSLRDDALAASGATAFVAVVSAGVSAWGMPDGRFRLGLAPPPPIVVPREAPPHADAANAVAVSPDGREAVVALENRLVVYSTADGRFVREL